MAFYGRNGRGQPDAAHRELVERGAMAFGFGPREALGRSRFLDVARMRHGVVYALHCCFPDLTRADIAFVMERDDHSTISHSVRAAKRLRERDNEFRQITDAIIAGDVQRPIVRAPVARTPTPPPVENRILMTAEQRAHDRLARDIEMVSAARRPGEAIRTIHTRGATALLSGDEITARRHQREAEIRARQMALLEEEQRKYNLPRRGRPLCEMVA